MRRLIDASSAKRYALRLHPVRHHLWRDFAGPSRIRLNPDLASVALCHIAALSRWLALGLHAPHDTSSAMNRGIKRLLRKLAVYAFEDHGIVTHRSADESLLAWECRSRAFAYNP